MKISTVFWLAYPLALPVLCEAKLTGFPQNIYDPFCAMACLRSLYSYMLSCSGMGGSLGMMTMVTSTECWATNTPYLTSLAWCMHVKCAAFNILSSKLEYFWETQATGQSSAGVKTVPAKWSYTEALANVTQPPANQLTTDDEWFNTTSLVAEDVYVAQWNVLTRVQGETTTENEYGIVLLATGFGIPIVLTMLGYVPGASGILIKLTPHLVWPSTIGTYHVRPLPYLIGNAPTVGQALYIALFVILNIILTSVNYQSRQPNAWYWTRWREIMAYALWRTGNLAFIIAPLIFLFASRNNILLWLTNWSHSTYIVLHRWVARVFTLQVLLHSIIGVVLYKEEGTYSEEVKMPFWIWGIIATISCVILAFGSGLYVRSFAYEFFLLMHLVLTLILIVGCWYHVYDLYKFLGGVEDWIYAMCAVWAFDRLWRVARVVAAGPRRAKVTEVGEGYVRVDIPGIRWGSEPGKHVYVYFPTLNPLRPWENHPFSVLPTPLLKPPLPRSDSAGQSQHPAYPPKEPSDVEKHNAYTHGVKAVQQRQRMAGLTLYVRKSTGMTKSLRPHDNLPTFVEGPYPNNSTKNVLQSDRLLLIGGGIGITGLLPFVNNHWNVKLAWSVRATARCLVDELYGTLNEIAHKDVRVDSRLDIKQLLAEEAEAGWERDGVVVSGPGALCDDVRAAVVAAAKCSNKTQFELEVEAYSW